MRHVTVVADTTASLPGDAWGEHGVVPVPYYVHIDGTERRDMLDLTSTEFNRYMRDLPDGAPLPQTANPGPGDYGRVFEQALERGESVVSFHMTSVGSGAYAAACLGREMALEKRPGAEIHVIDTRNVSMAHGWIALECARAAQQGAKLADVLHMAQEMIPHVRMIQTADTLRYLYMGGRIGRAAHLVSSALNIKPLISMDEGVIVTLGVARSIKAAFRRMVGLVQRRLDDASSIKVAITHADATELARRLGEMVSSGLPVAELALCDLSPALVVHSGPGTVGLCYLLVR